MGEKAEEITRCPDLDDVDVLAGLLVPAPDDLLTLWPVDPAINSGRSNGES